MFKFLGLGEIRPQLNEPKLFALSLIDFDASVSNLSDVFLLFSLNVHTGTKDSF